MYANSEEYILYKRVYIKGYKIIGLYMNGSTFQTIKYMDSSVCVCVCVCVCVFKGQVYELGRFINTDSHTCTTITL